MKTLGILSLSLLSLCACGDSSDSPNDAGTDSGSDATIDSGGDASLTDASKDASLSDAGADTSMTDADVDASTFTESQNNHCPKQYGYLTGTHAAGSSCSTYADCLPTCCTCTTSTHQFGAAACVNGTCAANPCPLTEKDNLCL